MKRSRAQAAPVVGRNEGYGHPVQVGSTGPANSVNVILGIEEGSRN